MLDKIKELFVQYKDVISYLFFGGLTTLVNIIVYFITYEKVGIDNVPSTALAWLFAVIFAFITNKLWVFESKSWKRNVIVFELISFFGCRIATGILDVVIMYFSVDCLHWNALLMKIISNVLVIILNYIASKLLVFSKKRGL